MPFYGSESFKTVRPQKVKSSARWKLKPVHQDLFESAEKFLPRASAYEFGRAGEKTLLVLGRNDAQVGYLLKKLEQEKVPFFYFDFDELAFGGEVLFDSKMARFRLNDVEVDLSRMRKIFVCLPMIEATLTSEKLNLSEKINLGRWWAFFKCVRQMAPKAEFFPISPGELGPEAQDRLGDLILARQKGLQVPEVFLTNQASAAKKRIKKDFFIHRELGPKTLAEKGQQKTFLLKDVREFNLNHLEMAPVFFQKYVQKKFEVRAYVIGRRVLACRIDSQKSKKSSQDWRNYDFDRVKFEAFTLPKKTEKALVAIAQSRGLKFCGIDLIYSTKNEYVFLEMNRPGAWAFIEALSGLPIARELARILS